MKTFNVLIFDFNSRELRYYNIIPYLVKCYYRRPECNRPNSFEEFKKFIKEESKYQWWSRCEYELVITGFPVQDKQEKIDVHYQVLMNIDIITKLLMEEISTKK